MSESVWNQVWQQNKYLIVALVACLAVCVFAFLRGGSAEEEPGMATGAPADRALTAEAPAPASRVRQAPDVRAQATIAEHQAKIDSDPKSPDAPGLRLAQGNLYRQKLRDYAEAARCYELLLLDHPDWEGIGNVYPQLCTCYEKLGETEKARRLFNDMLQKFPADSQEYLYAKTQLGE
ncbi:MAG: tetratricopeptide repeat protein [Candidatus Hydrogenedentes bacterium]|nr:tetratricopeptide repeat protein [Candidatus Hydrogenedentota bacterium]